ncbi:MAG: glycoside hydrolase family 43 protein [Tepidisphaeraceae bacterium]
MKLGYLAAGLGLAFTSLAVGQTTQPATQPRSPEGKLYLSQPLVTSMWTADPSAHVFDGRIYIYGSHDVSDGPSLPDVEPFKGSKGNGFKMRDYHVLSMSRVGGEVTIHPVALKLEDVPWAARQLWAPDAAFKNGTYYLYFPAKAKDGAFRIGVATAKNPAGPFVAEKEPIAGSYSIDPSVFTDDDGQSYIYFGGLSGGQLQMIVDGKYDPAAAQSEADAKKTPTALMPRVAKLSRDMLQFDGKPREAVLLDETGQPMPAGRSDARFFEGAWMHKYNGKYYLSYSTGGTHFIAYAISDSPLGPFTYKGTILLPVQGWTTHHSVVQIDGRWWLFYHDTQLSNKTFYRNIKVTELHYNADGTIQTIDPFVSSNK